MPCRGPCDTRVMGETPFRIIAVDWSGRARHPEPTHLACRGYKRRALVSREWPESREMAIEIWPRALTGQVVKSQKKDRERYLRMRWPVHDAKHRARAEQSEDAFDAAVSALIMDRHRDALASLPAARDELEQLEGRIWIPGSATA